MIRMQNKSLHSYAYIESTTNLCSTILGTFSAPVQIIGG